MFGFFWGVCVFFWFGDVLLAFALGFCGVLCCCILIFVDRC